MSFGRNFKRFRLIRGKSIQELADYLGIDESQYVQWEKDESEPTVPQLCALARYYGCTTDLLLDMI